MKKLLQLASVALLVGLMGGAARAADQDEGPGHLADTIAVPGGLSRDQVHKAIELAGSGRGWETKEQSGDHVVFFLERGKWRSTVTVTFDAKLVQVFSNSGKLDHKGGSIKKQEDPRWVRYLKEDIAKDLNIEVAGK